MTSVFPEEDLLATGADGQGFFITRPGFGLKAGRYTINRKIGRGSYSSTYLVFDEQNK
jgi:serine/threonine-protein kinase SRPK3